MDADAELDPLLGRQSDVALDHAALHFDCAAHRVHDAPEFDDRAIARTLDDAPAMNRNDGVDEIAAKGSQAREDAILVRAREPAISNDVRDQNRRKFSGLGHCAVLDSQHASTKDDRSPPKRILDRTQVAASLPHDNRLIAFRAHRGYPDGPKR